MGELPLNVKLQERIAGVVETAETIEAVEEPDMQGIYVGCAALLVVIVICAVILSRRSAKKKREAAEVLVPDVPSVLEGETEIEDAPKASVTMVSLTVLGKEKCFKGEMKDRLVVGRSPEPDGIRIDLDDEKMSRSHFVLRNVAGVLFIENVGKNGTYVNNVKISQVVEVHQQDVITIGTTNLKISWIAY